MLGVPEHTPPQSLMPKELPQGAETVQVLGVQLHVPGPVELLHDPTVQFPPSLPQTFWQLSEPQSLEFPEGFDGVAPGHGVVLTHALPFQV